MCGIAGILRIHPAQQPVPRLLDAIPEPWLDILDDSIKHRGPDGRGRFRQRVLRDDGAVVDVALVHRRLSIIDLAGGGQPMVIGVERAQSVSDGSTPPAPLPGAAIAQSPALLSMEGAPYSPAQPHPCPRCAPGITAVVFNGCIYNHRELRRELQSAGHEFMTDHSDTEVLLHGWRQWGPEVIDRLDGMYAAAVWDESRGELELLRDFAGEKPLYVVGRTDLGAKLVASSPVGLVQLNSAWGPPEEVREPGIGGWHDHAQHHVLFWLQGADWEMPYPDAHELQPGSPRRDRGFYRPLPARGGPALGPDGFDRLIRDAVLSRLEADVPLGCFLSGGVDSSLVAHYAREAAGKLRTFSVRMPDARYDESSHAERVAAHLRTTHETLPCDPQPAADLVRLIHELGLPFGDSSLLPAHWVSAAARQHVLVALTGDGADELFGGYERYVAKARARPIQHLIGLIPMTLLPDRDPKSKSSKLRRLVRACRTGDVRRASIRAIWDPVDDARVRGQAAPIGQRVPLLAAVKEWLRRTQRGGPEYPYIDDDLKSDFESYLPQDLLRKTDTASMAVALEVRAPFLRRELALAALSEPISSLMPGGQRKGLLKAVARKYLPAEIVDRPKQGFAIPISEWFRTDYGGMRQLLMDHLRGPEPFPGLAEAGINLNMSFVERMLREHDDAGEKSLWPWKGRDHGQRLYMLLVLSIWCKWLERVRRGSVA